MVTSLLSRTLSRSFQHLQMDSKDIVPFFLLKLKPLHLEDSVLRQYRDCIVSETQLCVLLSPRLMAGNAALLQCVKACTM